MSTESFRRGCEEIGGRLKDNSGTALVCVVGGKAVDTIIYDPSKETAEIRDHKGRPTRIEQIDDVLFGTRWMSFLKIAGQVMVSHPKGEDIKMNDYTKGK